MQDHNCNKAKQSKMKISQSLQSQIMDFLLYIKHSKLRFRAPQFNICMKEHFQIQLFHKINFDGKRMFYSMFNLLSDVKHQKFRILYSCHLIY